MRSLLRDRKAVTALEFGFVCIPLLTVIFFNITVGMQLFTQNSMDVAVQAAARQIRIGNQRGATDAGVRAIVCGQMSAYMLNCPDLQIYVTSSTKFSLLTPATVSAGNLSATGFSPGAATNVVLIEVAYPTLAMLPAMLPFMPTPPVFLSSVVFENEP